MPDKKSDKGSKKSQRMQDKKQAAFDKIKQSKNDQLMSLNLNQREIKQLEQAAKRDAKGQKKVKKAIRKRKIARYIYYFLIIAVLAIIIPLTAYYLFARGE